MPLVYQQNINDATKLGVWHLLEPESFFMEQVTLQRDITHPHKRLQHLAGRYLLKYLFPDFPSELIRIATTKKPFLENEAYHFSISHSGDYAAVMVSSENRVGVDIELVSSKVERVKHKFLSENEMAILEDLRARQKDTDPLSLLTATWSIKEALFKWYGQGEIDFKEHLVIEKMSIVNNTGVANCFFLKNTLLPANVHFMLMNENCLSWILSDANMEVLKDPG